MCQDTTYDESENATLGDSANAIRAKEGIWCYHKPHFFVFILFSFIIHSYIKDRMN